MSMSKSSSSGLVNIMSGDSGRLSWVELAMMTEPEATEQEHDRDRALDLGGRVGEGATLSLTQ
jgi:hypothetical protein